MKTEGASQTIHPEDLFKLQFIQDAQISPDGRIVVYAVSYVDVERDKECVNLWSTSLDNGDVRQLTSGPWRDGNPRWSPDGTQIAFVSNRLGKAQIYLIPAEGGAPSPLTAMNQGVGGGPEWSPDGKRIAFTAGPANNPVDTAKPYRVSRPVYLLDGEQCVENQLQELYVVSIEGGAPEQLTHDAYHNVMPVWSPDSQEILFFSSLPPDSYRALPVLRVVDLEGRVRDLLSDWGLARAAAWTPSGDRIVFVGNPTGSRKGTQHNLWVIDQGGGEPECRTRRLSPQVGGALQPDMPLLWIYTPRILVASEESVYVQVQDGGRVPIYHIGLTGTESWSPVVTGERACFPMGLAGERLLFMVSTLNDPTNLWFVDLDGHQERQLTHLNVDVLSDGPSFQVRSLAYPGAGGLQVEGWIITPGVGEGPFPTVLYIHGGPHNAFGHIFFYDFLMLASAGYGVLFVNHRGSSGYGDEFCSQIVGHLGELEYQDLMAGVDVAISQGLADPDRLGCCGLSGGGHLTCWIVGHTDRFKAAVAENPISNFVSLYGVKSNGVSLCVEELGGHPHEIPDVYRSASPITYAHRCTTPTLLIQGEVDRSCPPEQSEQFYAVLKANGCTVEMLRLPNSGHVGTLLGPLASRLAQNEALLEWMNRYLNPTDVAVSGHG